MAPVTLNKGNSINKAGVEVSIVPIMRSPRASPVPRRKQRLRRRPRSELGFRGKERKEEGGSLPDIHRKWRDPEGPPGGGAILNAVVTWLQSTNPFRDGSAAAAAAIATSVEAEISGPRGAHGPLKREACSLEETPLGNWRRVKFAFALGQGPNTT